MVTKGDKEREENKTGKTKEETMHMLQLTGHQSRSIWNESHALHPGQREVTVCFGLSLLTYWPPPQIFVLHVAHSWAKQAGVMCSFICPDTGFQTISLHHFPDFNELGNSCDQSLKRIGLIGKLWLMLVNLAQKTMACWYIVTASGGMSHSVISDLLFRFYDLRFHLSPKLQRKGVTQSQ